MRFRISAGALLAGMTVAAPVHAQLNFYARGHFVDSGSIVSLGRLTLTGGREVLADPGIVMFTLTIQKASPTTGTGSTIGSVSGSVRMSPNRSSLIWTPVSQTVYIDGVSYDLIFDTNGPAGGRGINIAINSVSTPTNTEAVVATPEPVPITLLATGLVGIVGAARRRNDVSQAVTPASPGRPAIGPASVRLTGVYATCGVDATQRALSWRATG